MPSLWRLHPSKGFENQDTLEKHLPTNGPCSQLDQPRMNLDARDASRSWADQVAGVAAMQGRGVGGQRDS